MGAESDLYGAGPQGLADLGVELGTRYFSPEAHLARKVGSENVGAILEALREQVKDYTGRNGSTHIEITRKTEVHGIVVFPERVTHASVLGDETYTGNPMTRRWSAHHHSHAYDITLEDHTERIEHMPVDPEHPLTDRGIMEMLLEGRYLEKETIGRILMRNKGIVAKDNALEAQATTATADEVKEWMHKNKIKVGNLSVGLTHDLAMNIFDELTREPITNQAV